MKDGPPTPIGIMAPCMMAWRLNAGDLVLDTSPHLVVANPRVPETRGSAPVRLDDYPIMGEVQFMLHLTGARHFSLPSKTVFLSLLALAVLLMYLFRVFPPDLLAAE